MKRPKLRNKYGQIQPYWLGLVIVLVVGLIITVVFTLAPIEDTNPHDYNNDLRTTCIAGGGIVKDDYRGYYDACYYDGTDIFKS